MAAKRKALLRPDEPFFNVQRVIARHSRALLALVAELRHEDPWLSGVALYGELYGGGYPDPQVAPVPGLEPVQTGVWYSPDLELCAFDLALERQVKGQPRTRVFMDWPDAIERLERHDILANAILARGDLGDAMSYSLDFISTLPARHGLAPLPAHLPPNLAEGIIARPAREITFERPSSALRPLLKRKHPRFAEDERYHEAQPWGERGLPSDALSWVERALRARYNPNRVAAALSKVGPPQDEAQRQALRALIAQDIWEELEAQERALVLALADEERALLDQELRDLLAQERFERAKP